MTSPARPGLPGKRGLEKPGKPGQGEGFEVSVAIEAWLFRPHSKIGQHFMAFPARKPEAGKAKNSQPSSTSDGNKNYKQFRYNISTYLLLTIRNVSIPKVL